MFDIEQFAKIAEEVKNRTVAACVEQLRYYVVEIVRDEVAAQVRSRLKELVKPIVDELMTKELIQVNETTHVTMAGYIEHLMTYPATKSHQGKPRIRVVVDDMINNRADEVVRTLAREELNEITNKFKNKLAEVITSSINS